MKRKIHWKSLLFWGFPVLLWGAVLIFSGGELLRYETTWRWIQQALRFLSPEHAPPGDGSDIQVAVTMYQINGALRRLSHIGAYAVMAALVVRFIQRGEPRLKRSSLLASLVFGLLYTGLDELHRAIQPARHAKWLDLYLNLGGVLLTILLTVLYFYGKEWERRLSQDSLPAIESLESSKR
jgi:VanZ family protein